MDKLFIDFETYSPTSIECGAVKYALNPQADIICMGYRYNNDAYSRVWIPGVPFPEIPKDCKIYAHNALFDWCVWHYIGVRYDLPLVPLRYWVDTLALANRYGFPSSLTDVGNILDVDVQKSRRGTNLIKKICVPNKYGQRPRVQEDYTYEDLKEFYAYCVQDVDSMVDIVAALPADTLNDAEQYYWQLTQEMNLHGLPIDVNTTRKILSYIEGYVEDMTRRVPEITEGLVEKVTQTQRMVKFLNYRGIEAANLQAGTVEKLLRQDLPSDVKELLELRQQLGRSSTAKYTKLLQLEHNGFVYNNLQYYGAGTGRWTGRGFQMHNLPRAAVKNPEEMIERFQNFEPVEDAVNVAKALIRPMVCAPAGYKLIVSDYSAIENYLLMHTAEDWGALEFLRKGGDQYKDMAAYLYHRPYDDVDKLQRLVGKIVILGCGYGMGPDRFQETAADWGVKLSLDEAAAAVNAYREKYLLVKLMWYKLKDCIVMAIQNPGREYGYKKCKFRCGKDRNKNTWLISILPSGRYRYYFQPTLSHDKYGAVPCHMGINPYSKVWSKLSLIPGRITENVIQALARDVMAYGLRQIEEQMPEVKLIGTVHDEALGLIANNDIKDDTLERFNQCLCTTEPWASNLPLKAEGYIAQRYRKG